MMAVWKSKSSETKSLGGVKGVDSGQDGYRDMAMYLTAMYQSVCYDADSVLEEGGSVESLC